jgi:hypothetical protein
MTAERAPVAQISGRDLREYATVQTWYTGLREQSHVDPDADPLRLEALRGFCEFVGKDPDTIIRECLREVGDQVKLSYKGRRHYASKIAEFEQHASNTHYSSERSRIGSNLRSFLIHNGIFLQAPALLR